MGVCNDNDPGVDRFGWNVVLCFGEMSVEGLSSWLIDYAILAFILFYVGYYGWH